MAAYYNEIDPAAAAILQQQIASGVIAPGDVDTRSIKEVQPHDLSGYTQCHFFAGGGLWSVAARLAGWPDDRPLWTGSCPCQPFSAAGKGLGTDDPRHLWPDFHRLIRECRPAVVFGEQVSNAAGTRRPIDAHMHEMWRREAILGLLQEPGQARQFEWLSCAMQDVLQGEAGGLSDWYEAASVGFASQIPGREPGEGACECGANAREAGRHSIRSGRACRCHPDADRSRLLRIDGLAATGGRRPDMGQPFARPDCPGTWLRDNERQGGSVRGERDDEHLGRGTDPNGCGRDPDAAGAGRGAPAIQVGAEAEGAPSLDWLDGIVFDLDAVGYSTRFADFPACSVDAPHQRNRLYWIAVEHAASIGRGERWAEYEFRGGRSTPAGADASGVTLGDAFRSGLEGQRGHGDGSGRQEPRGPVTQADGAECSSLDDADSRGCQPTGQRGCVDEVSRRATLSERALTERSPDGGGLYADADRGGRTGWQEDPIRLAFERTSSKRPLLRNGTYWSDAEWIVCHDDKARRAKPGIRFLVDGLPGRVDLWRVGGNAIVPQAAAEVIAAFMDVYGLPPVDQIGRPG